MVPTRTFLACLVTAFLLTGAGTAAAYHTRFVRWNVLVRSHFCCAPAWLGSWRTGDATWWAAAAAAAAFGAVVQ